MVSVISAAALVLLCAFVIYIIIKCKEPKAVKACFSILCAVGVLSVVGGVTVTLGCMEYVSALNAEAVDNARSAYFSFMLVGGVFALVIFSIALAAALMRHKFTLVRILVAHLGAIANVAVIAPMFCLLFNLFGVDIDIYVELLALCLGGVSIMPAAVDVYRLQKRMSTPEGLAKREKEVRPRRKKKR